MSKLFDFPICGKQIKIIKKNNQYIVQQQVERCWPFNKLCQTKYKWKILLFPEYGQFLHEGEISAGMIYLKIKEKTRR